MDPVLLGCHQCVGANSVVLRIAGWHVDVSAVLIYVYLSLQSESGTRYYYYFWIMSLLLLVVSDVLFYLICSTFRSVSLRL